MTLTEFLLARIAEDEAAAQAVADLEHAGPGWVRSYRWSRLTLHENGGSGVRTFDGAPSPARVLAECEAKRRIVDALEDEGQRKDIYNRDYPLGLLTTEGDLRARLSANARWSGLEYAARALALPYADHPDYRDEWRP